jgi:predicted ArsR family transcriptional regulator
MDQQTQAFLALISDELTTLISEALAAKPLSTTELAQATEVDSRVLGRHLETMKISALVRSHRSAGQGRGRPRIYWELSNADLVQELCKFVVEVRHRLIDSGSG